MALKEYKKQILSWQPTSFAVSEAVAQEELASDGMGTWAGCLHTAARAGQSPALGIARIRNVWLSKVSQLPLQLLFSDELQYLYPAPE